MNQLNKQHRKRIVDRHRDSLLRHGYSAQALYWSSQEIQELRFKVLAGIGIAENDRLLDVGCGFADFKGWINRKGISIVYTGVDLLADLLVMARERPEGIDLHCAELMECMFSPASFDWVILSGGLNEQLNDEGAYARAVIEKMFLLAADGVAFNVLNARHAPTQACNDLQSFDPFELLAYCEGLGARCMLKQGYLDNDFTICMHHAMGE